MAKQNRTTLKGYFETGDTPSQAQYADLIDSNMNLIDTGTQIVPGTISSSNIVVNTNITASGNVSASGVLTAEGLIISDDAVITDALTVGGIFQSNGINLIGNITASGTISGSTIEGQVLLAYLNITSSGNISASGNIIADSGSFNYIESINKIRHTDDPNTEIGFASDTVVIKANNRETFRGGGNFTRLGNDDTPTRISGSSIMFNSPINSTSNIITTQNIIATGNITSNGTGSFNGGLVLVSPNGDQFVFTVNNSGHLSLTGSAI